MQGQQPPPFIPAAGAPPQQIHLNPNFFTNPNNLFFLHQNPALLPHLNPFLQNPSNFPPFQPPFIANNSLPVPSNPSNNGNLPQNQVINPQNETIEELNRAAKKARRKLVSSNENVTAWKVSQKALLKVKAESWESLGFQMQQVPALNQLLVTEGKINAFIHCFVAARRITSLYDLEVEICESEGIEQFEELELGPLVRHPLIVHYFAVTSDVAEVYRIRTEEIISYLFDFMETHPNKEVKVNTFMDFISKKLSVSGREKLCVRIQSFGMYVKQIEQARQSEDTISKKCFEKMRRKSANKSKKHPLFGEEKKQLDDHFTEISQRIKSFSSETTQFCGKHIRFESSSSENDDSEDNKLEDNQDKKNTGSKCSLPVSSVKSERLSSCPYPSATEERTRLGLKTEAACIPDTLNDGVRCNVENTRSQRKRRSESAVSTNSTPQRCQKRYRFGFGVNVKPKGAGNQQINDHSLSNESLKMFVTTWKEECQANNADEVLDRMLQFYNTRKKSKVKALFTSYPFVGLLNAAVSFIKFGMWDTNHGTLQAIGQHSSESLSDDRSTDDEPAKEGKSISSYKVPKLKQDIIAEDIARKISGYFEDDIVSYKNCFQENKFSFLRKLCECQGWLSKHYSVNEFESLGYGEYFLFLEKYMHLLSGALQECLLGGNHENVSLEAHLLPLQLDILLSQAISSLWESETINLQTISELLSRQFPLVCFKLLKSNQLENFVDTLREKRRNMTSNCVLFSTPLLRLNCMGDSLAQNDRKRKSTCDLDREVMIGAVTNKDAIEVLLKAPMLSDLKLWSHWDILFAPSFGSIMEWLLKEINTKELLCLVTKDGKVIRVNHLATLDSFLKVFIQGSAFETVVDLLSLFVLYGGERNVPLSLLKCHARKAFEVIMNNMLEVELADDENPVMHGKLSCDQYVVGINLSSNMGSSLPNNRNTLDKTVQLVSKFILDCLSYLPIEFCSYAADVLISGLQSYVKGVPSAILTECKQIEQRLMLHEVGMSLGIMEWVNDYHSFRSSVKTGIFPESTYLEVVPSSLNTRSVIMQGARKKHLSSSGEMLVSSEADYRSKQVNRGANSSEVSAGRCSSNSDQLPALSIQIDNDPARVIESIRQVEFGLGQSLSATENIMLKKQHARLGRALHCLSQELYSQDSHFLLELVQNADDNVYPENEEPTLTFILQGKGIIVLNNEKGFLANNIRALCDVGNSTKKGHNSGYIGKKGIGFKSVFRVTDAPEIHSNGFHIKFDITHGQIGFVLPTIVPPCDIGLYSRLASTDTDRIDQNSWNTCIVLPFRKNLSERFALNKIVSMFSDLHPSLLLFLHRLQCIKFRNLLDDSLIVMRKEIIGDGIIQVSLGNEKVTWFVVSQKLEANIICSDVKRTEISIAFTLQEKDDGEYIPVLNQQPVFAFLPLRTYGLKFILQGDFVLPSSREEVDRNSPWNQWLLSEFPDLFVRAERSFCDLPCYRESPGKAVMAFLSFVPLVGEVHGFFSSLPRMIIAKLRMSNCLLLEGVERQWVPPCKVLRNWTEQARSVLPDSLLHEHLGLGFLNKDIVLSDSLASALGVEDFGPKILCRIISSLCHSNNGLKSMGFSWLSSLLSAIYVMLSHSSVKPPLLFGSETDFIFDLQKTPFVPLSNGEYCSVVDEDTIWLQSDEGHGIDEYILKAFPQLYVKLRIVSPNLLAAAASIESSCSGTTTVENVTRMLYKVGVQRLSAHEILKMHILPAICDDNNAVGQDNLMIEYLSFVMFHLQSGCTTCGIERDVIFKELREKAMVLTNYGYKRFNEVPLHFNQEYRNPINVNKFISGLDVKWHEVDAAYLKHPITESLSDGVLKWRGFFQDMGVTDFVQIVEVEKRFGDMPYLNIKECGEDTISVDSVAKDWKSEELFHILSLLSSRDDREKSIHLMEILDTLWDGYFSSKLTGCCIDPTGDPKPFKSSLVCILQDVPWVVSNVDHKLHYPKDLFHDCVAVNSVLGVSAPYTIPKVKSEKLLADIGLKTEVTLDDALYVLRLWRRSESLFRASVSQMSNFYRFLWKEMSLSKKQIMEELHSGPFIFIPHTSSCSHEDAASGALLSPREVYWHDNIGPVDQDKVVRSEYIAGTDTSPQRKMLCSFYPILHDFFVNECGVDETPPFHCYLHILLQLSATVLPHEAAKTVFEIFLRWADALKAGSPSLEDVEYVKESLLKKECTVLPTRQDRWVSLHASFGVVCWCDDEKLGREFKQVEGVNFLYLGVSIDEENQMLRTKVSVIMQKLGIPALSEVVRREAIYYGLEDCSFIFSLLNWILPYAQRYIYNTYLDKYSHLKQSAFENLSRLKIVVVDKLFYRNVIKKCEITSRKRHECNCLLQDNILYCSSGSESHSIFLEFSRFLFNGDQELHFANFLHMVTTMAQSGATEEQTEFFILNSQKVQKLPKTEESCWSLQSASSTDIDADPRENYLLQSVEEQSLSVFNKRRGINSNWPPADWKTAPGFSANAFELNKPASIILKITEANHELTDIAPTEISSEFNIDVDQTATTSGAVTLDSEISVPQFNISSNNMVLDSLNLIAPDGTISVPSMLNSNERDQVLTDQAKFTGRLGELVAFKYFVEKVGDGSVKWVNETSETGLPYDIIIESEESREYIEVKATKFERKNWFVITMREWQFAIEKGESFSIAHVILADDNMARVTIYKNPARLCQLGNLKLAFVVPKE